MSKIDPFKDGITHINIYSKGQTELGRWMSNFAFSPVNLREDGKFNSIEGYWYWLLSEDNNRDVLRTMDGWLAKERGRQLVEGDWPSDRNLEFRARIHEAIKTKVNTYPEYKERLKNSALPFQHYYVYGGKVVKVQKGEWILHIWEDLRKELKDE